MGCFNIVGSSDVFPAGEGGTESWTDHPDHDVGEASDPDGRGEEGHQEPSLPAALGTVGHGEEQKQGQRPHGQPLQLVTRPRWERWRQ